MNGNMAKVWTYGVAYLSLAVGSGVSIAGNIADTYRVSGAVGRTPDGLDIAISAFWPAAVLLAIEMFVSTLWPRTIAMQGVRWIGSMGIGFVAMYVSWHHLADLLTSRGQDALVSGLGPLAIDGLAVMATGLILSSRKRTPGPSVWDSVGAVLDTLATKQTQTTGQTTDTLPEDEAASIGDQAEEWLASQDSEDNRPVSVPPALARSNEIKPESVPETARLLFKVWANADETDRPTASSMYALVAGDHDVSSRTARRWYTAVKDHL